MIISPFLNILFNRLNKKSAKLLIVVGIIFISLICSLRSFEDNWLDGFVWFIFMYFVISYYKRYGFDFRIKHRIWYLLLGAGVYFFLSGGLAISYSIGNRFEKALIVGSVLRQYLGDYKSLPNFIGSLLIFIYFASNRLSNNINLTFYYQLNLFF